MLSDSSHEIRQQADSALSEFLQEIKNSPVRILLTFDCCQLLCYVMCLSSIDFENCFLIFIQFFMLLLHLIC